MEWGSVTVRALGFPGEETTEWRRKGYVGIKWGKREDQARMCKWPVLWGSAAIARALASVPKECRGERWW